MCPVAGGAQQGARGASCASLASDDFADIALGNFQFDYIVVELLDENFVGGIDQRFRNQLNQHAHISRGLGHSMFLTVELKRLSNGEVVAALTKSPEATASLADGGTAEVVPFPFVPFRSRLPSVPSVGASPRRRQFRRRSRRRPEQGAWRTVCSLGPTFAPLWTPSTQRARASVRRWRD